MIISQIFFIINIERKKKLPCLQSLLPGERNVSVPNQKTIIIHQSKQEPFLKIGIDELWEAYRNIKTPSSFVMYLYLAGNKDGYRMELSRQAFKNRTSLDKSSYHRAIKHLTELGYIYEDNCGRLNFATKPKKGLKKAIQNWDCKKAELDPPIFKTETAKSQNCNATYSVMNTEIDNRNNRENRETDNASRSSLSLLRKTIAPNGEYIGGEKKGKWLEDEVPNLWGLDRRSRIKAIQDNTDFTEEDALCICNRILDYKKRQKTTRLKDISQDIFYMEELTNG